jgi:hypothetical protein
MDSHIPGGFSKLVIFEPPVRQSGTATECRAGFFSIERPA